MGYNITPLESEEQESLVQYLTFKKLKFSAIPSGMFTKSWAVKKKNKREGLRPGVPDMMIILPKKLLFIELKRVKGGIVSEDQKDWIDKLNKIGDNIEAIVCKGCGEAIDKIEKELKK